MNAFPVIAQKAYSKTEARQGQGRDYRESIGRIYPPPPLRLLHERCILVLSHFLFVVFTLIQFKKRWWLTGTGGESRS